MRFRLVLAQLEPIPGSIEKNLKRIEEIVESYEGDLYVFPELFLCGYTSMDALYRLGMDLTHPAVTRLRNLCLSRGVGIVVGFPELSSLGYLYNSALAIDDRGEVYVYRKRHLPTFSMFDEARWFRASKSRRLDPWRFRGVGVGIAICYDVFFPEIFRAYALKGAYLSIVISASPDSSVPLFHVLLRARALENTMFIAWINTAGVLDGATFGGGSLVVAPNGTILAELRRGEEEVRVVELDFSEALRFRVQRPVIRDVQIEDVEVLLEAYREMDG